MVHHNYHSLLLLALFTAILLLLSPFKGKGKVTLKKLQPPHDRTHPEALVIPQAYTDPKEAEKVGLRLATDFFSSSPNTEVKQAFIQDALSYLKDRHPVAMDHITFYFAHHIAQLYNSNSDEGADSLVQNQIMQVFKEYLLQKYVAKEEARRAGNPELKIPSAEEMGRVSEALEGIILYFEKGEKLEKKLDLFKTKGGFQKELVEKQEILDKLTKGRKLRKEFYKRLTKLLTSIRKKEMSFATAEKKYDAMLEENERIGQNWMMMNSTFLHGESVSLMLDLHKWETELEKNTQNFIVLESHFDFFQESNSGLESSLDETLNYPIFNQLLDLFKKLEGLKNTVLVEEDEDKKETLKKKVSSLENTIIPEFIKNNHSHLDMYVPLLNKLNERIASKQEIGRDDSFEKVVELEDKKVVIVKKINSLFDKINSINDKILVAMGYSIQKRKDEL